MTTNKLSPIQTLPVELFHRIFNRLDAETIIFSCRPVCRSFRAVVNTYARYSLDFTSISKPNFHLLCRLIPPENVISITLCNGDRTPDQIDLFLSIFRAQQFTRLRSLTLSEIDEFQLDMILKRININLLSSFSLSIQNYDDKLSNTTATLLSVVIAQPSIRELDLHIKNDRIRNVQWPRNCTVQHFKINEHVTFDYLCNILRCSPHLEKILIRHDCYIMADHPISTSTLSTSFHQLTSLTIEQPSVQIDKLQYLLSFTPSLVYLKLIGADSTLDGNHWEQFIEANLSRLDKFEFFFDNWRPGHNQNPFDIELLIAPFRSPFWVEHNKWFVICEYKIDDLRHIYLYTIPVCTSFIQYEPHSQKISLSTYPETIDSNPSMMDNVDTVSLSLTKEIAADIEQRVS
jgi:hypothetical protein